MKAGQIDTPQTKLASTKTSPIRVKTKSQNVLEVISQVYRRYRGKNGRGGLFTLHPE